MSPEAAPLPRYQQIAEEIRDRIIAGELAEGDPVPSLGDMQREWSVSLPTSQAALRWLRDRGWVATRAGLATVVLARTIPAPDAVAELIPGLKLGAPVVAVSDGRSASFYRMD